MINPNQRLHRRDFLKLSGIGLLGALLPPGKLPVLASPGRDDPISGVQGRVLEDSISIYDTPSFDGKRLAVYWRDNILSLSGATVGDDEPPHNRVWYQINGQGYAHSGSIQPVLTQTYEPVSDIPNGGVLAEVTVPFTDARWGLGYNQKVAYRFYYQTTHWVGKLVYDLLGNPWYAVLEDKWFFILYVPARHLRLFRPDELAPLSPEVPPSAKRLEVHTDSQTIIAYEWDKPVFEARTATGAKFRNGDFATPPGRHKTFHKRPSRHMAAGNLALNGYDLPGVPWISYITESGVAFHGTFWHNDFGRKRSHGCINLIPSAAQWVYLWTLPTVPSNEQKAVQDDGTMVDVLP